jgi:hypothetical protein
MGENMDYLSFWVWFILLNMSSSSIHFHSLWLNNTPQCMYTSNLYILFNEQILIILPAQKLRWQNIPLFA